MRELVQIVLPVYDNHGNALPRGHFAETLRELTDAFGGATAFTRAPAEGFWEREDGRIKKDDVIVVEVMVEAVDDKWWDGYRKKLEARFRQDTVLIRVMPCRTL